MTLPFLGSSLTCVVRGHLREIISVPRTWLHREGRSYTLRCDINVCGLLNVTGFRVSSAMCSRTSGTLGPTGCEAVTSSPHGGDPHSCRLTCTKPIASHDPEFRGSTLPLRRNTTLVWARVNVQLRVVGRRSDHCLEVCK